MIDGFDSEKCEQRRRIVAAREPVEGTPLKFLASTNRDFVPDEMVGVMPETDEEIMNLINAKLPENAPGLSRDEVYVHFLEAANNSFIGDRYAFMSESTLRNIAEDAARGVAFMNSHRTGSISTPSELPFGKTFCGQYQAGFDREGRQRKCAMVGVYMLKGVKPTGENGPSTDDLHTMILGGQIEDVSVGLGGGDRICDVCSGNLADCNHVPGTRRAMTDDQIDSQTAKGVPGGKCSYTINNARMGEVSAVYDGAVPGAGVKKVMRYKKEGLLNRHEAKQARASFGPLLDGVFHMEMDLFEQVADAVKAGVESALANNAKAVEPPVVEQAETATEAESTPPIIEEAAPVASEEHNMADEIKQPDQSAAIAEMEAKLAALTEQLTAKEKAQEEAEAKAQASADRIAKLETEAQRKRFADEVEGKNGGTAWFGNQTEKTQFLMDLAAQFGEGSKQVEFYITDQRATAAQLESSVLFEETGRDNRGEANEGSAWDRIQAHARNLRAEDASLSQAESITLASEQNPELYNEYLNQGR